MKKILYLLSITIIMPVIARAATVSFMPRTAPAIGERWVVDVMAQSDTPINTVEGNIAFPTNMLTVQSLSTAGSAINIWIETPRARGSVLSFSGIAPGGFSGTPRRLFSIMFLPARAGKGTLSFQSITALMNDGSGSAAKITKKTLPFTVPAALFASSSVPIAYDTAPPEHFVPEIGRAASIANGAWFIAWSADDKQSGIAHYEICETTRLKCGKGAPWLPAQSPYVLRDQTLRSTIYIKAIDAFVNARIERVEPIYPIPWYKNMLVWYILIVMGTLGIFSYRMRALHSILFLLCISVLMPFTGHAATLFMSPASPTIGIGKTITIDIYVANTEESVNAVSGTISFPKELLSAQSVSKKDSALNWWTIEPTLSNALGTIVFEGVALKGFSGTKEKILSITFKAIDAGTASLLFSAGSVLANDGSGNNVLSVMEGTHITVQKNPGVSTSIVSEIGSEEPPIIKSVPITSFSIKEILRNDPTTPTASFFISLPAGMKKAGIYWVYINGISVGTWRDNGSHVYTAPIMSGGTHAIVMKMRNQAGQIAIKSAPFEIVPLTAPIISAYTLAWGTGMPLIIGRTVYPNATVRAFFEDRNALVRLYETNADDAGNFIVDPNTQLPRDAYTAWVEVVDGRGARSMPSNMLSIASAVTGIPLWIFLAGIAGIVLFTLKNKTRSIDSANTPPSNTLNS